MSREFDLMQSLGKIREERGLRQWQVAEVMGVGQPRVSTLENAINIEQIEMFLSYLDAIGIHVVLFQGEKNELIFEVKP